MIRILDLRVTLDREDRVRISTDGRELMRAATLDEALTFLGRRLERVEGREQLSALAGALVGDIGGVGPSASTRLDVRSGSGEASSEAQPGLTFCLGCRERVRLEVDGCPVCAMQRGPRIGSAL